MSDAKPLKVLVVEDSEFDARMLINILRQGGYRPNFKRVETRDAFSSELAAGGYELVLADYNMPEFSAPEALETLQGTEHDIPFIIVSGGIGEDTAVAAMKAGANDYLMKGQLARLVPAVERELRDAAVRAARRDTELRYRMLWENSTDAVLMMDENSYIHFANPAVKAVFGYEPEEMIGKNLTLVLPEKADPTKKGFFEVIHSRAEVVDRNAHETIGLRSDETQVAIEIAFNDMEIKGQRWYVAFIRDITARKEAERELREHHEQFRVAREIQERLFPSSPPRIEGLDVAGVSYPAEATGGDYFDYLKIVDGTCGFVVADVTGHGVGPAMLMAETRAYLKILALNREDPGVILSRADTVLSTDLDFERYISVIFVKIDPVARTYSYANAGHSAGFVFGGDGQVKRRLRRTGTPLGICPDVECEVLPLEKLESGDIIVLTTDGLEEATSPEDDFFGDERIERIVCQHREESAQTIIDALYRSVNQFTQGATPMDDLTMVVIKVV